MDGDDGTERGAAGYAQQAGLGQRVAQIALQHRTRQPERAADQRTEDGARQADLDEDHARGFAPLRNAEAGWPHQQRGEEGEHGGERRARP